MHKVRLFKVYTESTYDSYRDDYETFRKIVSEGEGYLEFTKQQLADLNRKVDKFNSSRWMLKPTPDYSLLVVENVTEVPLSELFEQLDVLIAAEEKRREADEKKKREAAEKRKAAKAEVTREKKLKQLEELQAELGLK